MNEHMTGQQVIGGMGGMWIPILFWILIAVVAILLFKWIREGTREDEPQPPADSSQPPLEILKQRFARGEIDQATYERMRKELDDGP